MQMDKLEFRLQLRIVTTPPTFLATVHMDMSQVSSLNQCNSRLMVVCILPAAVQMIEKSYSELH